MRPVNTAAGRDLVRLCWLLPFAVSAPAFARPDSAAMPMEQVLVTDRVEKRNPGDGDVADRLSREGVDFSSAGGISSLPVIRGLNDERIKLLIDGAETTSACANHMNPALSYLDASRIQTVEVIAGITPVSKGGDSLGGTILIESDQPLYADSEESPLYSGSAGYAYHSNGNYRGISVKAAVASESTSLGYSGAFQEAESYEDGSGDLVLDTLYRSENHNLTLGMRGAKQSVTLKLNYQKVPYQGFPNQYMDMTDNTGFGINLNYQREYSWGELDARVNWQGVEHEMGFFTGEKAGTMPMNTEGQDLGYKVSATLPWAGGGILRVGNEFHQFQLDDWWPAVQGSAMLGPDDYVNINDGERTRYALYAESENDPGSHWHTLLGLRYERVVMDAGEVQPYNSMAAMPGMPGMNPDAAAAADFNARERRRTDDNFDITALASYSLRGGGSIEFGYARKTRSPNLYERYSWGRGNMAMTMIGWYGDGNAYVGDIDLEPEVAHTVGAAFKWRDGGRGQLSIAPYYTSVDDYIDARQIGTFNPRMVMAVARPKLQFSNLQAELYGVEVESVQQLASAGDGGLALEARLNYTRGERSDDGGELYRIMPLNLKMALVHTRGTWTNRLELEWVDDKNRVDELRLEPETDSYSLVNIRSEYQWRNYTVYAGVYNLFDTDYDLPLGGVYLSGWLAGDRSRQFESLPGEGRSIHLGARYTF